MKNSESNLNKLFYTVDEAAELLSVSTKSVRRLIKRGQLSNSKALRKILIPRCDLEGFAALTC